MRVAALRTAVLAVLAGLFLTAISPAGPGFSSAAFTAKTVNGANTVGAAADWTPPTVSVNPPASSLKDTVFVSATAADGETGIQQVVIAVQSVGATTWTTLCTTSAAPYRCSWDTRGVADGLYDVRAIATDNAGYSTTSAIVRVTVANALAVTLSDPGEAVRGSVALTTTLTNAGTGVYTVRVEYATAGSGNWKTLCTGALAPYGCTWLTTLYANDFYDLRSTATTPTGVTTVSPVISDVLVDNLAPAVTMTDPTTPLSGTVTLAASATDAHSGVARVTIQYAATGSSTWRDACTLTAPPYSCRFATTTLPNGGYSFRATVADAAGNTAVSATVSGRTVDNTIASVAMEDPGAFLTGTAALAASANSTAGVASVAIQWAPSGTATWTTACTVTAAPYACAWNTKSAADGLYDFRAVLTDGAGKQTVSAVVSGRRIDNRAVRGADVQAANGGATAGRIEVGDTLTLTYSTAMSPASILSGWNGTATAVSLRLRDGTALGLGSAGDTLDVLRTGATVNLGSINLKGDYIKTNKTSTFNATMTAATVTLNGLPVTVVTISVGTLATGGALRTATISGAMIWTPSGSATDLAGTGSSTAPVAETGAADREF